MAVRRTKMVYGLIGLGLSFGLLLGGSANAIPALSISNSQQSLLITDNDGSDLDTRLGAVEYTGPVGTNSYIAISVGFSKPFQGSAWVPELDLFSVAVSGLDPTVSIAFSDNDFAGPPNANFVSNISGVALGSVDFNTYYGGGNGLFEMSQPLAALSFGSGAFSGSTSSAIPTTDPYSLTVSTIVSGVAAFDAFLREKYVAATVSEPATILLFAMGLLGFGLLRRNRGIAGRKAALQA